LRQSPIVRRSLDQRDLDIERRNIERRNIERKEIADDRLVESVRSPSGIFNASRSAEWTASITAAGSRIQPDRVAMRVLGMRPYAALAGGKASTE
jgi:hypothetical protein